MDEQLTFEFEKRKPIKGFPELHWTGKRPYNSTQYYPAQLRETFGKEQNGSYQERYDKVIIWICVYLHCFPDFWGSSSISRIFIMSERRLTPRGHTSVHLPQSMHLRSSSASPSYSPRRNDVCTRRMLKSVNCRAEHVALQLPHWKQRLNEGVRSSSL